MTVIESAVGEKSGKEVLHLRQASGQSSLISTWEGEPAGEIEVKVTTLDEAISVCGVPRLCKIDVEGFDLPVIRGLSHLISVADDEASIDRTRQCLELLRRLGDFQVNAAACEDMSFILPA